MKWDQVYFKGTGSALMFSLGVAKYLKENYDTLNAQVLTVSGGGVAGVALLTLEAREFDHAADQIATTLAPLHRNPLANIWVSGKYRQALELLITTTALPLLRNRLQIATTTLPTRQRKLYTGPFNTVEEVVGDLLTSSYIPLYFLRPPYLRHLLEVDGAASTTTYDPLKTLVVGVGYAPGTDIYLSRDHVDSRSFRSYEEQMSLYSQGYARARELLR